MGNTHPFIRMSVFTTILVFVGPWMHHLAYINMLAAVPSLGQDGAHAAAVVATLIGLLVSALAVMP